MTKIIDMKTEIKHEDLDVIGESLRNGELIIFPTETVYGVGAYAENPEAVDSIFIAKGRANDNPLIVHVSNFQMMDRLIYPPNDMEQKLIDAFMPGPFTLILKKKDVIPSNVSAGLDTIGIRMPDHAIAREIIEAADIPIAAPSANLSSRPSGTKISDIKEEFDGKVSYIVDGGETTIGLESTVVKVIDGIPVILRPGKITPEDIKEVVGIVKLDEHIYKKADGKVESPGMKYRHYAPNSDSILIYSDEDSLLVDEVQKQIVPNAIVIGAEEHRNFYPSATFYSYGKKFDYDSISHNIFSLLRQVDQEKPALILIEGVKKEGLGIAIMNRLIRSCSYRYIEK